MLGRCGWLQLCISCIFEFVFVFVFVYFPKESAEAPQRNQVWGRSWDHVGELWVTSSALSVEGRVAHPLPDQTTSPFSDHTSAGPWPCSSSNDWDQHIWNNMVSCITCVVGSQQWQLSWCWWATCLGLLPHCILVNQWIYSINHTGGNHFPWIKPLKQWQHPMFFSWKSQWYHRITLNNDTRCKIMHLIIMRS